MPLIHQVLPISNPPHMEPLEIHMAQLQPQVLQDIPLELLQLLQLLQLHMEPLELQDIHLEILELLMEQEATLAEVEFAAVLQVI